MPKYFQEIALALRPIEQAVYRGSGLSFKVDGKVMATLWPEKGESYVKLTPDQQAGFMAQDPAAIFPAPKSWGKQGWTGIKLPVVKKAMLKKILFQARENIG
mgnify:CR=1 FL=1